MSYLKRSPILDPVKPKRKARKRKSDLDQYVCKDCGAMSIPDPNEYFYNPIYHKKDCCCLWGNRIRKINIRKKINECIAVAEALIKDNKRKLIELSEIAKVTALDEVYEARYDCMTVRLETAVDTTTHYSV